MRKNVLIATIFLVAIFAFSIVTIHSTTSEITEIKHDYDSNGVPNVHDCNNLQLGLNILKWLSGKTWTVDDDLRDYANADFTRIQDAINVATGGDTILVYPGNYIEYIAVNKSLTIESESGAGKTTVDAKNFMGSVFAIHADNVNILGFTVVGHESYPGILVEAGHCNIYYNSFSNNWCGIDLWWSSDSNIKNNEFKNNGIFIIGGELSHFNTHVIENNTVNGKLVYYYKDAHGIEVRNDAGQVILANCSDIIVRNTSLSFSTVGVELAYTKNSIITNNNLSNNEEAGIFLIYSGNNTITNNNISNNYYGLRLDFSSNNFIYHNNFANNWPHVRIPTSGYANLWDDGYPSGGNYWSDYDSIDNFWGENQNFKGCDMIGDKPYVIDENNRDRYPLMIPWRECRPPITEFPDLNGDGKVNIIDVAIVARQFGKEWKEP